MEVHPMIAKRIVKPVLIVVLAVFLFSITGLAQERRHDLSFQYGFLSTDQLTDIFEDILLIVITLGNYYKEDLEFTGIPFLTYHYSANSRFGFGGAFGYYGSSGNLVQEGGDVVVGDFRERNYIAAAELDYHWIMRPGFQLYSGAGFGVRIRRGTYTDTGETDTVTKVLPAFHLNALGMRVGRKVGFFAELGVGYKGFLAAGINAQF
jgi:hypothetical protein